MFGFMSQSIVRKRPTFVTDHSRLAPDYDSATLTTLTGWSVQPGSTDVDRVNREGVLISWTAYGPAGVDVVVTDHILFQGVEYELDGEPARWPSPTGALDGTVLYLVRWVN